MGKHMGLLSARNIVFETLAGCLLLVPVSTVVALDSGLMAVG